VELTQFEANQAFAETLDEEDPLKKYREFFYIPLHKNEPTIYFCGNSLGLQPTTVRSYIETELEDWQKLGVEGHFEGRNPWFHYHKFFSEKEARLVGGKPHEVVVMNTLTVNLHLMLVSFYQPTKDRYKILMEGGAFPSDSYAIESQVRYHGLDPKKAIVEVHPREGELTLRSEDIKQQIEEHGNDLALVMLGAVNYYSGQFFDMESITQQAHQVGAYAGFDLAHAAGNVTMELHTWNVDFAVWCTYKYLNSGPGGVGGAFVHEQYADRKDLPRFAGWWGHDEATRFQMQKGFEPEYGAAGWQLSNAQVLSMAAHKASLDIFDEAHMQAVRTKSKKLTGYLEFLIDHISKEKQAAPYQLITPRDPERRGAQLSIQVHANGKVLFDQLLKHNVIADWREPDVIRVAPVPLYNTYEEVFKFAEILEAHIA